MHALLHLEIPDDEHDDKIVKETDINKKFEGCVSCVGKMLAGLALNDPNFEAAFTMALAIYIKTRTDESNLEPGPDQKN